MFSGLIREVAKVQSLTNGKLTLIAKHTPKIGDSISVNGICLTVIAVFNNGFQVELSPETLNLVAVENLTDEVHIEPAMQMGDRFEGHIVQGHIDTVGIIKKIEDLGNSKNYFIWIDPKFLHLAVPKGSIAIDGVSLTINEIVNGLIRLTIIPHTLSNTIFHKYKIGTRVNIETDFFARYIDNILKNRELTKFNKESLENSIFYSW